MNHLVRAQGSRGCVNACRCVLGVLARIACVSVRVHTHTGSGVEAMGGNGGWGAEGEGEAHLTDAEFCFDWSPGCTFQLDPRGGQPRRDPEKGNDQI